MSSRRPTLRALTPIALVAAMLLLAGCASAPAVEATGETTEITVQVQGMHYVPDVLEVPAGNELVVTFENTGTVVHDLVFEGGKGTEHLAPGESEVLEVGIIGADAEGWCTIGDHRAQGMELTVHVVE